MCKEYRCLALDMPAKRKTKSSAGPSVKKRQRKQREIEELFINDGVEDTPKESKKDIMLSEMRDIG